MEALNLCKSHSCIRTKVRKPVGEGSGELEPVSATPHSEDTHRSDLEVGNTSILPQDVLILCVS